MYSILWPLPFQIKHIHRSICPSLIWCTFIDGWLCHTNITPVLESQLASNNCYFKIKIHHNSIIFVRQLHSKPRMESYCWSSTDQSSWPVGLCYYNKAGVTELLIIRDPHHSRMCFKSGKIIGAPFLAAKKGIGLRFCHFHLPLTLHDRNNKSVNPRNVHVLYTENMFWCRD